MKKYSLFIIVSLMMLFASCEEDETPIRYQKIVFRNECSSDMRIKGVAVNNYLNADYELLWVALDSVSFDIPIGGEASQVTYNDFIRDKRTLTGESVIVNSGIIVLRTESSEIRISKKTVNGEIPFDLFMKRAGCETFGVAGYPYEYSLKADTAMLIYVFDDKKMDLLSENCKKDAIRGRQISVEEIPGD